MARSHKRVRQGRGRRLISLRRPGLWLWLWLVALISLVLVYSVPGEYDLEGGDVAAQNILAPRDMTYVSDILSARAGEDAARRVVERYTAPDPTVARQQYTRARAVLTYLRAVRADTLGSTEQRSEAVWAVPELENLPEETLLSILTLPDASWSRVQLEFLDLLDQVMRQEEIRETDLHQIQERIPTMVPLDMAQDEAEVVERLVVHFVRPNTFYDEVATEAARAAAREAVDQILQTYRSGQVIVREGTLVTELDLEALSEFGLTSTAEDDPGVAMAIVTSVLSVSAAALFVGHVQPRALDVARIALMVGLILTLFMATGWLLLRSGDLLPYLFPAAAAAMLVATTVGTAPAIAVTMLLSIVSGWVAARSLEMAVMVAFGGIYAVLTLPRYEQTGPIFRSGLVAGLTQALVILVFSIDELTPTPMRLVLQLGICVLGGLVSGGLTVGGLFVLAPLFDLTTSFRLTELSRPNHPLLQRLLREAPATFNHVMTVTSLAEQAAERIGANALLTRVGAYYHDVGKLARPYFFVENQQGLSNPHDRLDPYASLDVLAGHVRDGIEMAKKYHLPAQVRAFIPEHHGTMRVSFLYQKAVAAAGGEADLVDEAQFRYPGPIPQSRETLLVMLADSSEAATRARRPSTPEELAELIDFIFDQRMKDGQLDDAPITMAELAVVKRTYVGLLRGAFHPRIQYPEPTKRAASEPQLEVDLPDAEHEDEAGESVEGEAPHESVNEAIESGEPAVVREGTVRDG